MNYDQLKALFEDMADTLYLLGSVNSHQYMCHGGVEFWRDLGCTHGKSCGGCSGGGSALNRVISI